MVVPLTQKARGVIAMKLYGPWSGFVPAFKLVQVPEHVLGVNMLFETWFGRFCPPKPEHGYIDSRVVTGMDDLLSMLEQTKKVHAQSEVMLMTNFSSDDLAGSFVWTPSKVTLGNGNDGATAGKAGCITLPIVPAQIDPELLEAAGVPKDQSPYVEGLVTTQGAPVLVQLRYGPEPPASMDYVPNDLKVVNVVKAEGDLMEFAKIVLELPAGTVVDHFGGSLTSHYGVHCLTNGVPVVTTFHPEVGQRLKKIENTMVKHDPTRVGEWFCFGMRDARSRDWAMREMGQACNAALWVLHNAAALGEFPQLVGSALSVLVKLCTIACHGEARHLSSDPAAGQGRLGVFRNRLRKSADAIADLPAKRGAFEDSGTTPCGVGAQPWAQCTTVTIDLIELIRDLVKEPSDENLMKVISQANAVVNEAHNGGWWLNKFTTEDVFDACSAGAPHAVGYAFLGLQGMFATFAQTKSSVWKRVVGFKKKALLAMLPMERRPVVLPGHVRTQWVLHPVEKKLFAAGKRLGWMIDAPQGMVEDVLNGRVLPILQGRVNNDVLRNGTVLNLESRLVMGPLHSEYKAYTVPAQSVTMYDARDEVRFGCEHDLVRMVQMEFRPPNAEGKLVLCESCFSAWAARGIITLPHLCPNCGGVPKDDELCECGKHKVALMVQNAQGGFTALCWVCAWPKVEAHRATALQADKEAKLVRSARKTELFVMCRVPGCCTVMPQRRIGSPLTWSCGCAPSGSGAVALTLQKLKGLGGCEQKEQKG